MSTGSAAPRAPAQPASAIAFCADDERAYLRDIEKLTRQKIEVVPLPANFMAEAARIKATRAAVPMQEERSPRHDERRRHRPQGQRGRYASAVKPMGGSRRASRG